MKVNIETRFCPPILEACGGKKSLQLSLAGTTVADLIAELSSRYGEKMAKAMRDRDGRFDPVIQILVNGKEWIPSDKHSKNLRDGDTVSFMLLLAGG